MYSKIFYISASILILSSYIYATDSGSIFREISIDSLGLETDITGIPDASLTGNRIYLRNNSPISGGLNIGDTVSVNVLVNNISEINAVGTYVVFSNNLRLQIPNESDFTGSFIDLWVIRGNKEKNINVLTLVGGIIKQTNDRFVKRGNFLGTLKFEVLGGGKAYVMIGERNISSINKNEISSVNRVFTGGYRTPTIIENLSFGKIEYNVNYKEINLFTGADATKNDVLENIMKENIADKIRSINNFLSGSGFGAGAGAGAGTGDGSGSGGLSVGDKLKSISAVIDTYEITDSTKSDVKNLLKSTIESNKKAQSSEVSNAEAGRILNIIAVSENEDGINRYSSYKMSFLLSKVSSSELESMGEMGAKLIEKIPVDISSVTGGVSIKKPVQIDSGIIEKNLILEAKGSTGSSVSEPKLEISSGTSLKIKSGTGFVLWTGAIIDPPVILSGSTNANKLSEVVSGTFLISKSFRYGGSDVDEIIFESGSAVLSLPRGDLTESDIKNLELKHYNYATMSWVSDNVTITIGGVSSSLLIISGLLHATEFSLIKKQIPSDGGSSGGGSYGGGGGGGGGNLGGSRVKSGKGSKNLHGSNSIDTMFKDLINHWSKSYAEKLYSLGIVDAAKNFYPDNFVTRAELVKMSMEAFKFGKSTDLSNVKFGDVNISDWYVPYLAMAISVGVIDPPKGTKVDPFDLILVEQSWSKDSITNLQKILSYLGYSVDITGVLDDKTVRSVTQYQRSKKFQIITGIPGSYTALCLNQEPKIIDAIKRFKNGETVIMNPSNFRKGDKVNRAEAIKMLLKAAGIKDYTFESSDDIKDVSKQSWYYDYVMYAVSKGIINKDANNSVKPVSNTTRGQISAIIVRLLDFLNKK